MNPTQNKYAGRPKGTTGVSSPGGGAAPGQHSTPTGRASTLNSGMTFKRRIKIEKIARLVATGLYTDDMIANHIGVTKQYISQLKATKEFQNATIAVMSGLLSTENQQALESLAARRAELDAMVPMALMQLRNLALSRNPNIALRATQEILDREGNFAKVSKSSVELKTPEDLSNASKVGNEMLSILRGINPNTIQADPVSGIAPGFTLSAADAKQQAKDMGDSITEHTLDEIDAANSTVQ
jgi:hypothetical protein